MTTGIFLLLNLLAFASEQTKNEAKSGEKSERKFAENPILIKIEEDEYLMNKKNLSGFIGVIYQEESKKKWRAIRWSKRESKKVHNGYYDDEETAAHASDTLARKLMANGEKPHKLNFPEDNTEVHKKGSTSLYVGVSFYKPTSKYSAQRRSKNEKKMICNGYFKEEETAAHASDTLARKLMANGEHGHKLNFPDDETVVQREKKTFLSEYIGVYYIKKEAKWRVQRWSKNENKEFYNGYYEDEERAAHASDTLASKLNKNGEDQQLNFPKDDTEVYPKIRTNKRKRQYDGDLDYLLNKQFPKMKNPKFAENVK